MCDRRADADIPVPENRWPQVESAARWKPRLKASFQRRSASGIPEQGRMIAIGSAWATTLTVDIGQDGQPGRGGHSPAGPTQPGTVKAPLSRPKHGVHEESHLQLLAQRHPLYFIIVTPRLESNVPQHKFVVILVKNKTTSPLPISEFNLKRFQTARTAHRGLHSGRPHARVWDMCGRTDSRHALNRSSTNIESIASEPA